jgi:hypothetical protein
VPAPDFSNQIHDFDPGFGEAGLFWTIPVPEGSVAVNPGAGTASFTMSALGIKDFGSIPNGLFHFAPPTPSTVSFDVEWSGVTSRSKVRNANGPNSFGGELATTGARVRWSAEQGGRTVFTSSDSGQTVHFAQVGHEFNGAFFPAG